MHLRALQPDSDEATELRMLTRDRLRLAQQRTRCVNRLTQALKEYYRRPVEVFSKLTTEIAQDFLLCFRANVNHVFHFRPWIESGVGKQCRKS